MSEDAKKSLEQVMEKLNGLPVNVAKAAQDQFAARMEGYAEGFEAGKGYAAENRPS